MTRKTHLRLLVPSLLLSSAFAASAAVSLTMVSEIQRSATDANLQSSGITYAGGDLYYVVEDNCTNMIPVTLKINRATGSLATSGVSFGAPVKMKGAHDMEGCAFDPYSAGVWVSQETSALIREFDPFTGEKLRDAPVPAIHKQYYGNLSLESLTISGDGRTMWTVNEEALTCDGEKATRTTGTVVRLTKFTRNSVADNWTAAGQWAYYAEPMGGNDERGDYGRNGIADLCALPDGTLLAMERRCFNEGGVFPDFQIRIFQVDFAGADDVSGLASLDGATYKKVSKKKLWESKASDTHWTQGMPNYEGMCLGPRLDDGSSVLILICDGGSSAYRGIMTFKISGLDIREMYFEGEGEDGRGGSPDPAGGPYRYVSGTNVTATVLENSGAYEENVRTHWEWSAPQHGVSAQPGAVATFEVNADDTVSWSRVTNPALPLLAADSFEQAAPGAEASDLSGWSGDGLVSEIGEYPHATPPDYPLQGETHTRVLVVDGATERSYAALSGSGTMLDAMVRVTRERADSPVADVDSGQGRLALFFGIDGRATLQHGPRDDRGRTLRTVLSDRVFADGDWVRVSIQFGFCSGASDPAWAQVRLDGSPCVTSVGVRSPENPVSPGSWYRLLDGGGGGIASLLLKGYGAVDDVALYENLSGRTYSATPEFELGGGVGGEDAKTNGVPCGWLSAQGLSWDVSADVDGDGLSSRQEYAAGTDPWDENSFLKILEAGFDAGNRFVVKFLGADPKVLNVDGRRYPGGSVSVKCVESLSDLEIGGDDAWDPAPQSGKIATSNGTNTWTSAYPDPANDPPSRFYRIEASLE